VACTSDAAALSSTVVLDDPPSLAVLHAPYPQPAARAAASPQKGDLFTRDTSAYGSLLADWSRWSGGSPG
jgi:purine nucleoside permease